MSDYYHYDAGTLNAQFDQYEIVEENDHLRFIHEATGAEFKYDGSSFKTVDDSGNVGLLSPLLLTLAGQTTAPTTDDLADGEYMMYVADGSGANAAGDLVAARNNGGVIETNAFAAAIDFA